MKNKIVIIPIALVSGILMYVILWVSWFSKDKGIDVEIARDCRLYSNTGKMLPAKVLEVACATSDSGHNYEQHNYLIVFDDSLDFGTIEERTYSPDVLYAFPHRDLGESELGRETIRMVDNDHCHLIITNPGGKSVKFYPALYNNPPIKFVKFDSSSISFNTYGPLKQFGDTIVFEFGRNY